MLGVEFVLEVDDVEESSEFESDVAEFRYFTESEALVHPYACGVVSGYAGDQCAARGLAAFFDQCEHQSHSDSASDAVRMDIDGIFPCEFVGGAFFPEVCVAESGYCSVAVFGNQGGEAADDPAESEPHVVR